MKPKFRRKGGGRGNESRDKLHEFMVSVQNFVKSEGGHDEAESRGHAEVLIKRKSRKEMRKEKRKLKKKKKTKAKQRVEESKASGGEDAAPPEAPPEAPSAIKAKRCAGAELSDEEKKPKRKVHFEETAPRPEKKAKLQTMRKKALLEANEVEDREIKKLEKRLGLHKRKNKKSLPQSFVSDGLDYILGILEPGGSGLYDSDEDVASEKAKSELEELGEEEEDDEDLDESGHAGDEGGEEDEEDDEGEGGDGEEEEEEEDGEDGGEEEEEEEEDGEDTLEAEEEEDDQEEEDEDEENSHDKSSVSHLSHSPYHVLYILL